MSAPHDLDPSSSVLAFFGAELRRLRCAAAVSQEDLGQQISYSGSLVGMVETARRAPSRDFAQRCDEALATGGALARLWPLVSQEALPRWFRPFAEIEREATSIRAWEPLVVPGRCRPRTTPGPHHRMAARDARGCPPPTRGATIALAKEAAREHVGCWLVLEVQLKRFPQVGQGFVNGPPLTCYLDVKAPCYVPVAILGDCGSQPDSPAHARSLPTPHPPRSGFLVRAHQRYPPFYHCGRKRAASTAAARIVPSDMASGPKTTSRPPAPVVKRSLTVTYAVSNH